MFVHHSNHVSDGRFQHTNVRRAHEFLKRKKFCKLNFYTFCYLNVFLLCMKKCFTENNFYLPLRIMDPKAIFVCDLPNELTYHEIKNAFHPFQPSTPLQILKNKHYVLITFETPETMRKVLNNKDSIKLQGKTVTIKQSLKQFQPRKIHLSFSFLLSSNVLFPPLPN